MQNPELKHVPNPANYQTLDSLRTETTPSITHPAARNSTVTSVRYLLPVADYREGGLIVTNKVDLRNNMVRPIARVVPMALRPRLKAVQVTVRSRGLTPEDLLIVAYPKSGSTWLRFMMADIANGAGTADFSNIRRLSPPLGKQRYGDRILDGHGRLIKVHDAAYPAISRSRTICLIRDGRDVAVSAFHYARRNGVYDGDFDDFIDAFLQGRIFPYGSWQDHTNSWLEASLRSPDRITTLRYEDLLSGGASSLKHALVRIGLHYTEEEISDAYSANAASAMRKKESSASRDSALSVGMTPKSDSSIPFVRSAKTGEWLTEFSPASISRFEATAGEVLHRLGYP